MPALFTWTTLQGTAASNILQSSESPRRCSKDGPLSSSGKTDIIFRKAATNTVANVFSRQFEGSSAYMAIS